MDMMSLAQSQQEQAAGAAFLTVFGLFYLAIIVLMIAAYWRILTKAGEDGWKILIPFWGQWVFARVVGRPGWWGLLLWVPIVNLVFSIIMQIDLAKSFGKEPVFAVGLVLLGFVFHPILGFGDARYQGPSGPEPRPGWQRAYTGGGPQGPPQGGYQPPPGQQWGQQSGQA